MLHTRIYPHTQQYSEIVSVSTDRINTYTHFTFLVRRVHHLIVMKHTSRVCSLKFCSTDVAESAWFNTLSVYLQQLPPNDNIAAGLGRKLRKEIVDRDGAADIQRCVNMSSIYNRAYTLRKNKNAYNRNFLVFIIFNQALYDVPILYICQI